MTVSVSGQWNEICIHAERKGLGFCILNFCLKVKTLFLVHLEVNSNQILHQTDLTLFKIVSFDGTYRFSRC
jgi:hypothetical protein